MSPAVAQDFLGHLLFFDSLDLRFFDVAFVLHPLAIGILRIQGGFLGQKRRLGKPLGIHPNDNQVSRRLPVVLLAVFHERHRLLQSNRHLGLKMHGAGDIGQ